MNMDPARQAPRAKQKKTRPYRQVARALAAEETGARIVQAFLARLMEQGFDEITLDRVAADAGVSVQTIIRRFGGKDGLLADAVRVMADEIDARRVSPPESGVEGVIEHLLIDYEQTGDAVVRLLALAPRHPAVEEVVTIGRKRHRAWVSAAFREHLEPLPADAWREAVDALVVATDVYTWTLLRRDMKRARKAVGHTMRSLVQATLAGLSHTPGEE